MRLSCHILKEDYIQSSHKYKNEGTFISEEITKYQDAYRFHGPWDWHDVRGKKVSVFCDEANIKLIENILKYQGAIVIEMNNAHYFGRRKQQHIIFHPENQEVNISQLIEDGMDWKYDLQTLDCIGTMFREMKRKMNEPTEQRKMNIKNCRIGGCLYCK